MGQSNNLINRVIGRFFYYRRQISYVWCIPSIVCAEFISKPRHVVIAIMSEESYLAYVDASEIIGAENRPQDQHLTMAIRWATSIN